MPTRTGRLPLLAAGLLAVLVLVPTVRLAPVLAEAVAGSPDWSEASVAESGGAGFALALAVTWWAAAWLGRTYWDARSLPRLAEAVAALLAALAVVTYLLGGLPPSLGDAFGLLLGFVLGLLPSGGWVAPAAALAWAIARAVAPGLRATSRARPAGAAAGSRRP